MKDILSKSEPSIYAYYYGSYVNRVDSRASSVVCVGSSSQRVLTKLTLYEFVFMNKPQKLVIYSDELLSFEDMKYLSNDDDICDRIVINNRRPYLDDLQKVLIYINDNVDHIQSNEGSSCIIVFENLRGDPPVIHKWLDEFFKDNFKMFKIHPRIKIVFSMYDED